MSFYKDQHDKLLAEMPEGVSHDADTCNLCKPEANDNVGLDSSVEGGDMKTYTEDEFTQAVREAVAPLQAELTSIRESQAQGEVESLVAQAKADADVKVAELQTALDTAELRASNAEKERDDLVAYLESVAAEAAEAAAREAKREERVTAVKELAFSDEYVASRIDRWVAMDDDSFAAALEDWKALPVAASKSTKETDEADLGALAETAMNNTRTEGGSVSDAKLVFGAMLGGTDVRKIH